MTKKHKRPQGKKFDDLTTEEQGEALINACNVVLAFLNRVERERKNGSKKASRLLKKTNKNSR